MIDSVRTEVASGTFEAFVHTLATDYPMNAIAQSYFEDWLAGHPIDGGVAYEPQLRRIVLDGSLASLATLDKFLDAVKSRLAPDYSLLQQRASERNLLTFIAFYAGLVWCYQANLSPHWVSFGYLAHSYPALARAIDDDFSYSLAVSCQPIAAEPVVLPLISLNLNDCLFFPLVTIVERLYPRRQSLTGTNAPFFGYINASLAKSVTQLVTQRQARNTNLANDPAVFEAENASSGFAFIHTLPKNSLSHKNDDFFIQAKTISANLSQPTTGAVFEAARFDYQHPIIEAQDNLNNGFNVLSHDDKSSSESSNNQPSTTMVKNDLAYWSKTPEILTPNVDISPPSQANHANVSPKKTASMLPQPTSEQRQQQAQQAQQEKIAHALRHPQIHKNLLNQRHSMREHTPPTVTKIEDIFSELEADLLPEAILPEHQQTQRGENFLTPADELIADLQRKKLVAERKKSNANNQKFAASFGKKVPQLEPVRHLTAIDAINDMLAVDTVAIAVLETPDDAQITAKIPAKNPDITGNNATDQQYQQARQQLAETLANTSAENSLPTEADHFANSPTVDLNTVDLNTVALNTVALNTAFKNTMNTLQMLAKQQHTGAMLQLALLRFRGVAAFGIAQDTAQALKLVEMAANLGDNRAQKLLSRLYFSGQLVPLDIDLATHWLEQAASNGHPEAKKLLAQMAVAQELRHTRQNDELYIERLVIGTLVLLIGMVVMIFLIKI